MHFRLALPADAPAIAALHAASWAIAYDHILRADWLAQEGIVSISLNPDTVVETWLHLAKVSGAKQPA